MCFRKWDKVFFSKTLDLPRSSCLFWLTIPSPFSHTTVALLQREVVALVLAFPVKLNGTDRPLLAVTYAPSCSSNFLPLRKKGMDY